MACLLFYAFDTAAIGSRNKLRLLRERVTWPVGNKRLVEHEETAYMNLYTGKLSQKVPLDQCAIAIPWSATLLTVPYNTQNGPPGQRRCKNRFLVLEAEFFVSLLFPSRL